MKAGVKTAEGPGNFEIREMDQPRPGDNDVLVEIKASGVCGADVMLYDWTYRGRFPVVPPIVLGHEGAGIIVEKGKNVTGLEIGDRVTNESIIGCGSCWYCREEMPNMCPQWAHLGITFDGTFCKYARIPAQAIHRLPDNVSFEAGALIEPLSIATHTMDRIKFYLGETVAIIGPGVIGLLLTMAFKSYGASKIIVLGLERDKLRLEKAKELGADVTIVSDSGDPVEEVKALTEGRGADVVIEAGGTPESFNLAYRMVRGGGQIAALGYSSHGELEPIILARQEITVYGLVAFTSKHFSKAINWIQTGKVDNLGIVSHRMGLDQAEEGILLMKNKEATKVLLTV